MPILFERIQIFYVESSSSLGILKNSENLLRAFSLVLTPSAEGRINCLKTQRCGLSYAQHNADFIGIDLDQYQES